MSLTSNMYDIKQKLEDSCIVRSLDILREATKEIEQEGYPHLLFTSVIQYYYNNDKSTFEWLAYNLSYIYPNLLLDFFRQR